MTARSTKPLQVDGVPIANGRVPALCVPLVAATAPAILDEVSVIMQQSPDVLEWRVDHYAGVADVENVVALARRIREAAPRTPLIFTLRCEREGGAPTRLDDGRTIALYGAICSARCAEFVDYELGNGTGNFARVQAVAREHGVGVIGSFHDFSCTPDAGVLAAKFEQAKREGADVAKVAVMPADARDVLTLLDATWQAAHALDMPLISMAMGSLGALSRIAGHLFGSSLTFAAGERASAPGQMPIDALRRAIALLDPAPRMR